ncbi:unnamed protein product [[Candida] boidinii]|nr:unnamed protein product [[Candida] boidinii]
MTPNSNMPYASGIANSNPGGGLGLSFAAQQNSGNIGPSTAARQVQPVTTGISSLQSTRNRSLSCISNSSTFNGIKNSPLRKPKVKSTSVGNKSEVNTPTGTSVSGSSAGTNSQAHIPSSLVSNNSYSNTDHSNKSSFSSSRLSSVSTVPTAHESNSQPVTTNNNLQKNSITNSISSSNTNNRPSFSSPYVSSKQDSHLETGSISNKRRASDLLQNFEDEDEEDQQSYNMLQSLMFDGTNETSSFFDEFKGDSIKPNFSFNDSGNNSSGDINNKDTNSEGPEINNKLNNSGFSDINGNEINREENFSESTIMNKIADNNVVPVLASSDKNAGGTNMKFFGFNEEITPEELTGQLGAPIKMFDIEDYPGLGDAYTGNSNSNSNGSGENNSNSNNMDNNLNTENIYDGKDNFTADENWNNQSQFNSAISLIMHKISTLI